MYALHIRNLYCSVFALVMAPAIIICPNRLVAQNQEQQNEPTAQGNSESSADSEDSKTYTVPISVTGVAVNGDGQPLSGATIYLVSEDTVHDTKLLARVLTDDRGFYSFDQVLLPVHRVTPGPGARDAGGFRVYGTASGYGLAWRSQKLFHPNPIPAGISYYEQPGGDQPRRYERTDKIELDITFPATVTIHGRIVDDEGLPVVGAEVAIWNIERICRDGYGPLVPGFDRRPFNSMDNDGIELLNADAPVDLWVAHTKDDGRFELDGMPAGCRCRTQFRHAKFPARIVWISTAEGMRAEYEGHRLYDAQQAVELVFARPIENPIRVVYEDTGGPAPGVMVSGWNESDSVSGTSDAEGRVILSLPPGDYRLSVLPAYGTPYLETESHLSVGKTPPDSTMTVKLPRAAQVRVRVLDRETGMGIANVDLWRQTANEQRREHYVSAWESATRIVHRDRRRTDENGVINTLFAPGRHLISVGLQALPPEYRSGVGGSQEIECKAGEEQEYIFYFQRRP